MTCKDCIHYDVCNDYAMKIVGEAICCHNFMNKSKFIELPFDELRFEIHKGHLDILKEFYHYNKYLITEQMKDTLIDAIECMKCIISIQEKSGLDMRSDTE